MYYVVRFVRWPFDFEEVEFIAYVSTAACWKALAMLTDVSLSVAALGCGGVVMTPGPSEAPGRFCESFVALLKEVVSRIEKLVLVNGAAVQRVDSEGPVRGRGRRFSALSAMRSERAYRKKVLCAQIVQVGIRSKA